MIVAMHHHWTARAVGPHPAAPAPAEGARPAVLLRAEFTARAPVRSARLLVTALGVYELALNGAVVGDHVLAPGWTSYRHRHRYQTFDVTGLVREGRNAWGAHLADGWYRGLLGFNGGTRDIYGDRTGLLAELRVEYADGSADTVSTGDDWRWSPGPVLAAGLYEGEEYDARRERPRFSEPGFDDSAWRPVEVLEFDTAVLFPADSPPVRRVETVPPVAVTTSPTGRTILDFGQNLVGRLRIRVRGEAGRTVTLRHAEVLEDGDLCTRPLRHAHATDRYTLRGDPAGEEWEPRFTFHGFRYADVDGWPGELRPADVTAVVLHSDLRRTGWFACSDPSLNRLHENVVRGMRGNFVDVPTDCPQRDERLGWTGDVQVFAPTAAFLYDVQGFLRSWLRDLAADQRADERGVPPVFSPDIPVVTPVPIPPGNPPMAGWCDAAVIVPWVLYERYGDTGVLREQYPSMRAWVDAVDRIAGPGRVWGEGFQFGDWLDPAAPADDPGRSATSSTLVATAYFAHSARLLARTAEVLGDAEEATRRHALADAVRAAFRDRFHTGGGRLREETQTAYALALCFGLLTDDAERAEAGRRLAGLVAAGGHRIGTGFLGTPLVCDALTDTGHVDTAYRLLTQRACPSWLYQVDMGATTVWERWDSMLPDGRVNPGEMTSFNHYALGAVADWMHRTVAGLAPAAPGYRTLLVRPRPGGGLTWVRAELDTPYGRAETGWRTADGLLLVALLVPPGTTARVELPGRPAVEAGPGRHSFQVPFDTAPR
ncbi:family 78 glycoside hydrolase catalytic domain [Streptomyces griseoviridis]|uniref:alpha-L-rhamnosidase n=2 Tax=Streptomyces griseoviridis TaxID=45398 RepID=A0ABT9LPG9_STRGD|nr:MULTISPECIES: alpha-L-rhamnosidase [Streptomyces]MDP9685429.1 alpha-L-rhamnosidase [Streptomyces griseoviridis]GGS33033.1 alpha-L-rhamnosidase [Streptomyces niveoruber]GGS87337.1 alpha-L-rhamnosidase [Streptomyces griseoviridis]